MISSVNKIVKLLKGDKCEKNENLKIHFDIFYEKVPKVSAKNIR